MASGSRAGLTILLLLSNILAGCGGIGPGSPNASVEIDREIINVGESANFDARGSTSPEPTIIDEYRWDFGDGNEKTTKQGLVSHIYEKPGNFEIEVLVVNDEGSRDSASITVFVNEPPEIGLSIPDFVKTGQTATLDASSSTDFEGGLLEFSWDFDANMDSNGDGDPTNDADHLGPIAKVSFNETGNHTGALTAVDDNGATTTSLWTLRVLERTFRIVWEEMFVDYEWSGYLEQSKSEKIEHFPGEGGRIISVSAHLTLARDLLPVQWPDDNFSIGIDVPLSGWRTSSITTQENITQNTSASISRSDMNSMPESGITVSASSKEALQEQLLNQPGQRFGQGLWEWTITALECDPDLPIDDIDPDQGNDWKLEVKFLVLILRISEVGI